MKTRIPGLRRLTALALALSGLMVLGGCKGWHVIITDEHGIVRARFKLAQGETLPPDFIPPASCDADRPCAEAEDEDGQRYLVYCDETCSPRSLRRVGSDWSKEISPDDLPDELRRLLNDRRATRSRESDPGLPAAPGEGRNLVPIEHDGEITWCAATDDDVLPQGSSAEILKQYDGVTERGDVPVARALMHADASTRDVWIEMAFAPETEPLLPQTRGTGVRVNRFQRRDETGEVIYLVITGAAQDIALYAAAAGFDTLVVNELSSAALPLPQPLDEGIR